MSDLRKADLYWAAAYQSSFRNADLTGAKLAGADLKEADFTGAALEGADLGRDNLNGSTSLQGAKFLRANLRYAILEGANYDIDTAFPEGFDPISRGMIFTE